MERCVNHPERSAVEHCEVCRRPLCGLCLWYGDDGRRLCAGHAQDVKAAGGEALPPETYAEAIDHSHARPSAEPQPAPGEKLYRGNSQDLLALVAAVMSLTILASCFGGAYCLPLVAVIAGVALYRNAPAALDPHRTRTLSWVSIGVGGLFLLLLVGYIAMMAAFFGFAMLAATAGP